MSNAKIIVVCDENFWFAKTQRFFSYHPASPYHVGILIDDLHFYDMSVQLRKLYWPVCTFRKKRHYIFEVPVPLDVLWIENNVGTVWYGFFDVLFYPFLKLLKWDAPGSHCSEWVAEVLAKHLPPEHRQMLLKSPPPTPAELLWWLSERYKFTIHNW